MSHVNIFTALPLLALCSTPSLASTVSSGLMPATSSGSQFSVEYLLNNTTQSGTLVGSTDSSGKWGSNTAWTHSCYAASADSDGVRVTCTTTVNHLDASLPRTIGIVHVGPPSSTYNSIVTNGTMVSSSGGTCSNSVEWLGDAKSMVDWTGTNNTRCRSVGLTTATSASITSTWLTSPHKWTAYDAMPIYPSRVTASGFSSSKGYIYPTAMAMICVSSHYSTLNHSGRRCTPFIGSSLSMSKSMSTSSISVSVSNPTVTVPVKSEVAGPTITVGVTPWAQTTPYARYVRLTINGRSFVTAGANSATLAGQYSTLTLNSNCRLTVTGGTVLLPHNNGNTSATTCTISSSVKGAGAGTEAHTLVVTDEYA